MATDRLFAALSSKAIKAPCLVSTTANITLNGLQTIDGIALTAGDRVLVKDQTDTTENGIYAASSSTWQREPDFDGDQDIVKGTLIRVTDGTSNGDSFWEITSADPIIIGTSSITLAIVINAISGVSPFVQTLLGKTTAAAFMSGQGITNFAQTILDDADASAALTTLGVSAYAKTLLDDADAAAALVTLGLALPSQAEAEAGTATTARIWSAQRVFQAIVGSGALTGGNVITQHENLVVQSGATPTTDIDIDADAVVVRDGNGLGKRITSINLTCQITASGVNGLDSGSEAADTWYYIWVIWNGTTAASLLSVSSTAPTMPSGYTYKGLVGAIYNDSSSDLYSYCQRGNDFIHDEATDILSGGVNTSYTSVDLSTRVPPIATGVRGAVRCGSAQSLGRAWVAATNQGLGETGQFEQSDPGVAANGRSHFSLIMAETQTIYYRTDNADPADISITGGRY